MIELEEFIELFADFYEMDEEETTQYVLGAFRAIQKEKSLKKRTFLAKNLATLISFRIFMYIKK